MRRARTRCLSARSRGSRRAWSSSSARRRPSRRSPPWRRTSSWSRSVMTEAYAAMVCDRLDRDRARGLAPRSGRAEPRRGAHAARSIETLLHDARTSGREVRREPVDLDRVVRRVPVAAGAGDRGARRATSGSARCRRSTGEEALLSGVFSNLLDQRAQVQPAPRRARSASRPSARRRPGAFEVESDGPDDPGRGPRARSSSRTSAGTRGAPRARRRPRAGDCRRIVERHGGEIGVRAADGSGNVFYFTLPA